MAIAVMCLRYCGLLLSEEFLFIIVKLSFTSHAAILNYHRAERSYFYNTHRFDLGGKWNVANHWVAAPGVVT